MKKIICFLLSALLIGAAVLSASADANPAHAPLITTDEAIAQYEAETGETVATHKYYFQMPDGKLGMRNDQGEPNESWYNAFDHGACIYWWGDVPCGCGASDWPGYSGTVEDDDQHIYSAEVPAEAINIIWNNGVFLTPDSQQAYDPNICQTINIPCEYAEPGEFDTIPEGCDSFDECIFILQPYVEYHSELHNKMFDGTWYFYYGDGCYGMYAENSPNFKSVDKNCCNPDHFDAEGNHIGYVPETVERGDYDKDGDITIIDATRAQRILAELTPRPSKSFLQSVDADGDKELTIMDATRIQNVIALLMTMDGMRLEEYELPPVR